MSNLSNNTLVKADTFNQYGTYLYAKEAAKLAVKEAEAYAVAHNEQGFWEGLWKARKERPNFLPVGSTVEKEIIAGWFRDIVWLNDKRDKYHKLFKTNLEKLSPAERVALMKAAQSVYLNK